MISYEFLFISIALCVVLTGLVILYFVIKSQRIMACNRRGIQYKDWEMWDDAVRCFQKALDLDPSHALSHYNLGFVLYFGKNLPDAAIREFENAIAKNKKMASAYYTLGHALFHSKGALDQAMSHLARSVKLDPSLAQAYNTMGLIAIKLEIKLNHG